MVRKFVVFKGKKFYAPFKCLCCGIDVSEEQFCFGRVCAYCDCGRCLKSSFGYDKEHNRKDIFENAEDVGDEFEEMIKEKIEKIKDEKSSPEIIKDDNTKTKNT